MFLESNVKLQPAGWIEVVCGSMFSGKTEELLRRLKRARYARQHYILLKPEKDIRYSEKAVVSHDENAMDCVLVKNSSEILRHMSGVEVIGIDEAQFFDDGLPKVCENLAVAGKRVIIAGLDMDFRGKPFGPIPQLLAMAEYVTKVHAICPHCGNLASHSYRFAQSDETILLGASDSYEPRCRKCFSLGDKLRWKKKSEPGK
ncbi:MAG: thymidine kinase [Saprospirales bacterium]|nr:MAG: thymidine kinase [Saprospirales bacterium]